MNIPQIKRKLHTPAYDFLKENKHLGSNVILLGLGGSHAYGTNIATSDLDIRGVALNSKKEILLGQDFEQVTDNTTDTVIYSFKKMISLLLNCNPNTIELLGLKPEHYLYVSDVGQKLLDNKHLFLSQKAVQSFGGYATSQLRRLDNKAMRNTTQEEQEKHILNSINNARYSFLEKYHPVSAVNGDYVNLYLDNAIQEDFEKEIFMDIQLSHYPLRDYKEMWNEMNNIVKEYAKVGKRNQNAATHGKLAKHMMHLLRLNMMCLDLLERGEIITYREKEHDLLMSIRRGDYLDKNNQPIPEFFDLVREYENKLEYAKIHTELPIKPDYDAVSEFVADINESIVVSDSKNRKIEDYKIQEISYEKD